MKTRLEGTKTRWAMESPSTVVEAHLPLEDMKREEEIPAETCEEAPEANEDTAKERSEAAAAPETKT